MAPDDRPPSDGEFRIIAADEIDGADRPVVNVGPATGETELPHWTEAPTGQVPAVVLGDDADTERGADPGAPRWRSEHDTDDHGDLIAELTGMAPEPAVVERLGVADEIVVTDDAYLNFDDVELDPRQRRGGSRRRRQRALAENDQALAAIMGDDSDLGMGAPVAPAAPRPISTRASRPDSPATDDGGAGSSDGPVSHGRNVPIAAAVGTGLAIIALLLFKAGPAATMLLIEIVIVAAGVEFFGALQRSGFRPATLLGVVAIAAYPIATYWKGESALSAVLFLTFVFGIVWFLSGAGGRGRPVANLGITLLGVIWIGMFGSYAALIVDVPSEGVSILLLAVIASVAHDVGGFFIGRAIGRAPLSNVSPNKTVEGLIGGMGSTLVAVFVAAVVIGIGPFGAANALLFAIVLAIVAPLGDLAESLFKRDLGLKDMGSLIPEHGGLLDRFDGILFVLPAAYYVTRIIALN